MHKLKVKANLTLIRIKTVSLCVYSQLMKVCIIFIKTSAVYCLIIKRHIIILEARLSSKCLRQSKEININGLYLSLWNMDGGLVIVVSTISTNTSNF